MIAAERTRVESVAAIEWHALPVESVLRQMGVSVNGLDPVEAARRLADSGANELHREATTSPLVLLLGQFKSLIVGILITAAFVSGVLGEWLDASAILAIVVLNGLIGFYQEYSAERALAALKRMTAPNARVRREGRSMQIPARDVVPGDIVELEPGDLVPADVRVIESASFQTNEAPLTGESTPVEKLSDIALPPKAPLAERSNMAYLGTSVASGRAVAVVVATAMQTEFGRIMNLLATADSGEQTPLQVRLRSLGRILVFFSLGLVALIFAVGLARGMQPLQLFMTSVSLAVAAVPEGLPAVVTVALALGVQRMAKRRALVRRLHAVETLGSTSVICSDKTGTLTVGEMTVRTLWVPEREYTVSGEGYAPDGRIELAVASPSSEPDAALVRLLTVFVGCNGAALAREAGEWKVIGDPTEGALLSAGLKALVSSERIEANLPKVHELPFDSDRKRMTVVRRARGGPLLALVKGAPDVLLELCTHVQGADAVEPLTESIRDRIATKMSALAESGMRVLAAAQREIGDDDARGSVQTIERDLVFVGLAGMVDPPRAEAKDAVQLASQAGIRVVMITGDHPRTAGAIARDLGIARTAAEVMTGAELDCVGDAEFESRVESVSAYARVTAGHKLRIVRAWKQRGAVAAMTGDGVNDAPAIRGADVGIAMGKTGTEVTKEASDMVITDDNFASIVAAVEQGRGTYENIRKTLQYLLAGNVGELLLMTTAVLIGLPLPLMPVQLLWINLVTDGLPALCLATDPIDRDVMKRRPRPRSESITDRSFVRGVLLTGLLTAGVVLVAYLYALDRYSLEMARAHAFTALVYAELLRSFGARSSTKPLWRLGLTSNVTLAAVVAVSLAIQFALPHIGSIGRVLDVPEMPLVHCLALFAMGAIPFVALELVKLLRSKSEES